MSSKKESNERWNAMLHMQKMKARYMTMQRLRSQFEDDDGIFDDSAEGSEVDSRSPSNSGKSPSISAKSSPSTSAKMGKRTSTMRWKDLRSSINPEMQQNPGSPIRGISVDSHIKNMGDLLLASMDSHSHNDKPSNESKAQTISEAAEEEDEAAEVNYEDEDALLDKYWSTEESELKLPSRAPLKQFMPPTPPDFEEQFEEKKAEVTVTVGKVPKTVIKDQKDILKKRLWEERERALGAMKAKEEDMQWREKLAKQRVENMELDARERLAIGKSNLKRTISLYCSIGILCHVEWCIRQLWSSSIIFQNITSISFHVEWCIRQL